MDVTGEKNKLENEKREIEAYLKHPISRKIFEDNKEQQEEAVNYILERPVTSLEDFLKREQALGHLRGLRRATAIIQTDLDEIKQKIEEL